MKNLFRKVAIAALSATVIAGAFVPAQAMPTIAAPAATTGVQSDATLVQYRDYRRGGYDRGYYGGNRGYYGGYYGGSRRTYGTSRGFYSGYQGYRTHRPGYRYYDGYWYPLAAFSAGALIGGAIAAPRYVEPAPVPVYRTGDLNPRHYEWCQARYRSYDAYSNTFQPYNGPRRTCTSPYY
ncbi:BA14K family protein [Neorhizobium sp. T786]|uniref:BA14K family protein n=1 Tax=Pseudorhizobium xiangyangii TaxID=2883104 RepID=UPI001CFFE41C|nr:BA14K family protein [Neorhizobium xiangyangii]MCB5203028.1 BA14K family protein [Neorhizobium xiangyangii]